MMPNVNFESGQYRFLRPFVTAIFGILAVAAQCQPNFVIIFCDDLGYGDLSCYGQKQYKTPFLDKMAKEGTLFTDFSVASPGCSPSRAALLTGCLPPRVSLNRVLAPDSQTGLSLDEETIAEVLKNRGYRTGMVGKWHLGTENLGPTYQGFDEFYGLPYSNDMWPPRQPPLWFYRDKEPLREITTLQDQDELTGTYTDLARSFIRENRNRPFFLYMAHSMPHVPLGFGGKLKGRSGAGQYGDVIQEIDWSTGQILAELKKQGLDENTLVIFTSDNGPWLPYGNHAGSSRNLREGKGTVFEGGVRVPCIARWPGRVPAGRMSGSFWTAVDILPTLSYLANSEPPKKSIDGLNAWKLLSGESDYPIQKSFPYYLWSGDLQALRWGDWKLHFPHAHRRQAGAPGQDGKSSGEVQGEIGLSLFNLRLDPAESVDLSLAHPDVVRRMERLAEYYRMELGDSAKEMVGRSVRQAGTVVAGEGFPVRMSL